MNVKSTYLYDELNDDKQIYVKPPSNKLLTNIRPDQVLRLNKALYNLKQAGRWWYKKIYDILTKIELKHANYDHAVFYHKENNKSILIIFMHVNDITIINKNIEIINEFKQKLKRHMIYTNDDKLY